MTSFILSDAEVDRFLADDAPYGDLTTRALGIGDQLGHMVFRARGAMVVACSEEAVRLLERAGCRVEDYCPSGTVLAAGDVILVAEGPAGALLLGWKVSQTLLEAASGIATAAHGIIAAARAVAPRVVVACTRKTFPGGKGVSIKAVLSGGASAHRLGLSETVLVFPEHRVFLPDAPLAEILADLKRDCPEKKIVVEVNGVDEAVAAVEAGADVVQLEKFSPDKVAEAVTRIGTRAVVAAAGGVNAGNAAAYAKAGAGVLVTSSPYWAPPADVAVTISKL